MTAEKLKDTTNGDGAHRQTIDFRPHLCYLMLPLGRDQASVSAEAKHAAPETIALQFAESSW